MSVPRDPHWGEQWDARADVATWVGNIALRIPELHDGRYIPSLLEPCRRAERALLAAVQQAHMRGSRRYQAYLSPPAALSTLYAPTEALGFSAAAESSAPC